MRPTKTSPTGQSSALKKTATSRRAHPSRSRSPRSGSRAQRASTGARAASRGRNARPSPSPSPPPPAIARVAAGFPRAAAWANVVPAEVGVDQTRDHQREEQGKRNRCSRVDHAETFRPGLRASSRLAALDMRRLTRDSCRMRMTVRMRAILGVAVGTAAAVALVGFYVAVLARQPTTVSASEGPGRPAEITQLGVFVPLPGVADNAPNQCSEAPCTEEQAHRTITFTFRTGKKGRYRWQCFVPCAAGFIAGFGGPMQAFGYMAGYLDVV